MSNIDYTLWPNADGQLGQNKVTIPDGVTTQWPKGDALVGNFVYNNGLLSGFVDTKALIVNETKSSTIPYDYVNIHLESIAEGDVNIVGGERTKYFIVTYGSGNSGETIVLGTKYANCTTIDEVVAIEPNYVSVDVIDGVWNESLEKLVDGNPRKHIGKGMFCACSDITTFNSNLKSLTNGEWMFYVCDGLTSFNADLSSLMIGDGMFHYCESLPSFTSNLNSLSSGVGMFEYCTKLMSFESNLNELVNGSNMFKDCHKLQSFTSELSSLVDGDYMFAYCKLSPSSLKNIHDTLRPYGNTITLGLGCDANPPDINAYADEAGLIDMTQMVYAFEVVKGWTVEWQFNGRPSSTYSLRRPSEETLPVFAKLEEVEEIDTFSHTSLDGSKKYNLHWFHMTSGSTEGYTQYTSIEEAEAALNIKRVEK